MIPGSNLLAQALTLIRTDTVVYHQFTGRTTNSIGLDVSTYAPPQDIQASVQAVPRKVYDRMGLDYSKRYIMLWSTTDLADLARDSSGDQITWQNQRHELMDEDDWTAIDGWNGVLAVRVRNE